MALRKSEGKNQVILPPANVPATTPAIPKIKGVHPYGSKILIECLKPDEMMGTTLYISEQTKTDGAPQAYIVELGPQVDESCGVKVGQRIYWEGKGVAINDPRAHNGRIRALLEIHNIKAIIEEE